MARLTFQSVECQLVSPKLVLLRAVLVPSVSGSRVRDGGITGIPVNQGLLHAGCSESVGRSLVHAVRKSRLSHDLQSLLRGLQTCTS